MITDDQFATEYTTGLSKTRGFLIGKKCPRDLAIDFSQEAWVRAWTHRATWRGDSSFVTWVRTIAFNLWRTHLRGGHEALSIDDIAFLQDDGTPVRHADQLQAPIASTNLYDMNQLMIGLRPAWLLTIRLRLEGLEALEISVLTGMPEGTVKTNAYRAIIEMRAKLAGDKPPQRRRPRVKTAAATA